VTTTAPRYDGFLLLAGQRWRRRTNGEEIVLEKLETRGFYCGHWSVRRALYPAMVMGAIEYRSVSKIKGSYDIVAEPDDSPALLELRELVLGLYEDDKARLRRIRAAARFLVDRGDAHPSINKLARTIDP
jgi:hypothetical protein